MFNSIKNVIFKENLIIHVEFQNGETKCYDFKTLFERYPIFKELEKNENLYYNGKIDCGGFGIIFNDEIDIAAEEIFNNGILVCKKEISDINMKIANQISLARNKKNLTQTELAKITGIHQAEISKIERGIGNPSIKTLERIAQGLELTLELFLK